MRRRSSPTSTTARPPYSRVKVISVMATSRLEVPGETPADVLHQPEHDPRLAPELGEDPADRIGRERQEGQHDGGGDNPAVRSHGPAAPQQPEDPGGGEGGQAPGADHQPERPVGDRDDRAVVAGAVQALVVGLEVVDPFHATVEVAGGEEGEHVRDADREELLGAIERADREQRERRGLGGLVQRLGRGHLHRLDAGHDPGLLVAGHEDEEPGDEDRRGPDPRGRSEGVVVRARPPSDPPHGDGGHERPGRQHRGNDRVQERDDRQLVGQDSDEVGQFRAAGGGVERVADRVLHPGVGGQDEVGGQDRADRGDPDRGQVEALRQSIPAEDPEAEERRFEEEREEAFDRQRRAEDVADEPAVGAPVHAELELLDDPGDDAQGEVDEEQLAVEPGQSQVGGVAAPDPDGLEARDQEAQSDRQRDEQEVVDGRDAELPPGQVKGVHVEASCVPGIPGQGRPWSQPTT